MAPGMLQVRRLSQGWRRRGRPRAWLFILLAVGLPIAAAVPVAGTAALGQLTVTPPEGPVGTRLEVRGGGYPRGWAGGRLEVTMRPAPPAAPAAPVLEDSIGVYVDETGAFRAILDTSGLAPGRYTVFAWSQSGPDQAITETIATLTAAPAIALPATGGGGRGERDYAPAWLLGGALTLLLIAATAAAKGRLAWR